MRRVLLTALLSALVLSVPGPLRAQQDGQTSASTPELELHSDFWLNLHHFLYLQARLRAAAGKPATRESQTQPEFSSARPTGDLTPTEQRTWSAALDTYAQDWASRDMLRNGDMVIVSNRLAELEDCSDLSGRDGQQCVPGLRADLVAALLTAAPIYRAHWWPQQDRENRAWMASVTPLVRRMGSDIATRLVRIYQHPWPPGRMRVDVVWYAGPLGSYTTFDPAHITISSHDSRNQGLAAFEMLFHEASHTFGEGVDEAIERHSRELGKLVPRDLWHAILFYTTGELVRREIANSPDLATEWASTTGYTPYAVRNGVYDNGWSDYQPVIEQYWQAYLDGEIDFDTAIERIVNAV